MLIHPEGAHGEQPRIHLLRYDDEEEGDEDSEDSEDDKDDTFQKPECAVRGHQEEVTGVAFDPKIQNPNVIASSSYDETIKIWDVTSGSCLSTLSCGSDVNSIALKDNMIAAGCYSGEIKLFGLTQCGEPEEIHLSRP